MYRILIFFSLLILTACASINHRSSNILIDQNNDNTVLITNKLVNGVAQGTGILINNEYILTVKHMSSGNDDYTINFHDGTSIKADLYAIPANVPAEEMEDMSVIRIDLAILKLKTPYKGNVTTKIKCELPSIGTDIYTIGAPDGFERMVTFGHVSMRESPKQDDGVEEQNWFIADLHAFMGNSGGGTFIRETGEVIGIVSAIKVWHFGDTPTATPITFIVQPELMCDFLKTNKLM